MPYWTRSERIWKTFQISGLDIKACPGRVDLVPGHINFCGYVPDWTMIFQSGHVLIFSAVHISFAGLVQILAGHIKKFAGHVNFFLEPLAWWACKPNAQCQALDIQKCWGIFTFPLKIFHLSWNLFICKVYIEIVICLWQHSIFFGCIISTHCGLVIPYGKTDLGQYWCR